MTPYKLTIKFYAYFILILLMPSLYLNKMVSYYLNLLPKNNIIFYLNSLGFLQVPTTIGFLLFAFYLLNKRFWKFKPINYFFKIPNIEGRYEGNLTSNYNSTPTYEIIIEVRQTLTDITISLFTKNSSSCSIFVTLCKNVHGGWSLYYIYNNETNTVNHDEDMKNHYGVAFLDIIVYPKTLKGYYFNNPRDRGRFGNIEVRYINKVLKGSF